MLSSSTVTLATTKSLQGGYKTANRGTQTPFHRYLRVSRRDTAKIRGPVAIDCHGWWNVVLSFWTILKMIEYGLETCQASKYKILKFQAFAGKVKLLLFWDWNGPRLECCLDQDTAITTASYTEILKSKQKPAIHYKRKGLLPKGNFCCCVSTSICIPQQLPLKQSDSWNLIFSHTSHIVST